jgi:cytochrome c553
LNLDPLGWGGVQYVKGGTKDQQNGKLFKNIPIYDTTKSGVKIPTTFDQPYILVISQASASDAANYWYSRAGVGQGTLVIQTYRWNGSPTDVPAAGKTLYVADYSLWLRADPSGHAATPFTFANTVLRDNGGSDVTSQNNMTTVWRDGFAFGPGVATVASADVSLGIDVETTGNIANLYDSNSKGYVPDSGTEMSKYCAACHTDYLSGTRTNNTGVYSTAHRHATAQDRLTCVRCHYAHGSEALTMKDANDNTFTTLTKTLGLDANAALQYLADPNPSSAIKRYTGMSVCYACHGKGEAFLSNPNITGDATTHQYLKSGDPGLAVKNGDTTPGSGRTDLTTRHNANTAGDANKAGVN